MFTLLERARTALAGQYAVERELGRGGMGAVMLAQDIELARPVAIKVLPPELAAHAELRERFLRETRMAAGFNHPNIVSVYSVEQVDGLFCLIMEFVDGETLTQRVRRGGPLTAPEAVRLFEETGWALAYAHSRGVVHRDVKPDNILLERATGRALITDFGIARTSAMAGITQVGEVIGTPQFMSPEQAAGEELDGRSDLYSLGVSAFFALTGKLPFHAPTTQALLAMHLTQAAPRLATLRPDLPADLCAVVDRCLAKLPDGRFAGGEALVSEVEALRITKPVVAPAVRLFHQQANQAVRFGLVLLSMGALLIPEDNSGDQLIILAFLLAAMGGLLQSLFHRAQFLLRQGFRFDDIRAGFRTVAEEGAAGRQQLRNSPDDMARHRRRMRVAVITGGLGILMAVFASVYLRERVETSSQYLVTIPGLLVVMTATIMISLAIVSFITDPVRAPRLEQLTAWIWRGRAGQLLFRLAARGMGEDARRRASTGDADTVSIPTGVAALVDTLDTTQRRKLGATRVRVARLEARASELNRRERELEGGLEDAATPVTGDSTLLTSQRDSVVQELEAAREATRQERVGVLERLEAIRLQLIRVRAGVGRVEDVEGELK